MKRLAKETAVYGLSSIVGRFLNWLLVPMYVRVLDNIGEFGIYTNLYAWVALLLIMLTYGMETALFRFINKENDGGRGGVYGTILFCVGCTSAFFIAAVFLLLQPVANLLDYGSRPEYLGMMAVVVAVDAFCSIPFAWLRHKRRPLRFMYMKFVSIFLNIGLNIFFLVICPYINNRWPEMTGWFYVSGYGVGYVFIANVITTMVTLLLLIPDILPGIREKIDLGLLKKMLRYSFPILILGLAGIFNQTADKILFPFLFEDENYAREQLGIYGACFKIAVVMVMFIQAFRYAYEPFIFSHNREKNDRKAYSEAMKYFIIFSLIIFIGVMYYLDILKYFVSEDCYPGLRVVPIVMAGELFFGIYFNLSLWYKLIDKTEWGAYFSIAGCVATVGIIILFAPAYGYMACAWASFICNMIMMLMSYFVGKRKFPVEYDLKSALVYFIIAAVLYCAGMYPEIDSLIYRLIYRTALLLGFIAFAYRHDFYTLKRNH